jgi:hypothetical protein
LVEISCRQSVTSETLGGQLYLAGLFSTGWGSSPALIFGEELHDTFAKGGRKNLMQIQFLGKTT